MKKLFSIVAVLGSILYGQGQAHAFDLLNTARPDKVISVGIRAGFNSSNLTNNYKDKYPSVMSMNQQWRNGFSLGAVVDLNLAGFFTIQPGVFVSTRKTVTILLLTELKCSNCTEARRTANILQCLYWLHSAWGFRSWCSFSWI